MGYQSEHASASRAWWSDVGAIAERQHGVITRGQLLECGLSRQAIKHRVKRGRLHPVWRTVYAVGRPALTREGRWMAAVLRSGEGAVLSHASAAALWGVGTDRDEIEVSIPMSRSVRAAPIRVHRRRSLRQTDITTERGIPVTSPLRTVVDLAVRLDRLALEAVVNDLDGLGLIGPEALRAGLDGLGRESGVARLRRTLDRHTFRLTESRLERRFLPIARRAGLPTPLTQQLVNGYRVDFLWPELGLVVETDGLRYHRTAAQQARDRRRDQAHVAAGLTVLRFTHDQVAYEPEAVELTLRRVVVTIRSSRGGQGGNP
jgi:very-short-patch-repair endonuclease